VKRYRCLSEIRSDLASGVETLPGLVQYYLDRIESHAHLNAFLEVWGDEAMAAAHRIDEKRRAGKAGRLAGMVIGIKDNICYQGHKVSASSRILEGFESLYSATAVDRLVAEDAIIIGRCNCDEFAMGSSNENSAYGPVLNPFNTATVPGGSSGGSAAAVAADLCHAALGSDTGGSIRQPASITGIVGLKPTYGRVSRHGLIAYASSFDQIGPMTASVEDAALLLEVIAGPDEFDSTVSRSQPARYAAVTPPQKPARIAVLRDCYESPGLNPEVRARMDTIVEGLRQSGHTINFVDFPYLDYIVPTYYVLTTAEASSNLARFDGIHFGYRSQEAAGIEATYRKSRSEGFGSEVKRRIMLGTFVLSSGYYDAYYTRAQRVRSIIRRATRDIFGQHDYILTPTTTNSAFRLGENAKDPIAMYLEDIFTVQANLAGIPAISIPLGRKSSGMPFGIQLMGDHGEDERLLGFSLLLEAQFSVNS
jgi:aspartyl-tRNA(Asn)/glutamyl-tRNA(Gln) amidotransferase subunit A